MGFWPIMSNHLILGQITIGFVVFYDFGAIPYSSPKNSSVPYL